MEACGTGHYWGRKFLSLRHTVRLLHPGDVARYRDGNKTDRADAKALLEAARNKDLDPVPVKTEDQQAMVALHRLRQGYLRTRTARINAVRGHLGCSSANLQLVLPVRNRSHLSGTKTSASATMASNVQSYRRGPTTNTRRSADQREHTSTAHVADTLLGRDFTGVSVANAGGNWLLSASEGH